MQSCFSSTSISSLKSKLQIAEGPDWVGTSRSPGSESLLSLLCRPEGPVTGLHPSLIWRMVYGSSGRTVRVQPTP